MLQSIFQQLYTLLSNAIFNGTPESAVYGEFFCEGISIIACAFLVAFPFLIVWRVIRRLI